MLKIKKCCPICSKIFFVPQCHQSRFITCSHKCGGIYRRKPRIENICEYCNKKFINTRNPTKPQRFCSTKCSSQSQKNGSLYYCKRCNKQFYVVPSRIKENTTRGQFCSNKCRIKTWNENSIQNQARGSYRKNAWKTYEQKCYDCGNIDKRVLIIHHIDGNRKHGKLKNLIPVCHNCHCIRHLKLGNKITFSALKKKT